MEKFNKTKKLLAPFALVVFTLITLLTVVQPVGAWSGSGDGGGGTTSSGNGHWMMLEGADNTPTAWSAFLTQIRSKESAVKIILENNGNTKERVNGLVAGCKKSKYVWYLSYDSGSNKYAWANQAKSSHKGSFHKTPAYNESTFYNVFAIENKAQWESGKTVLVCSYEHNRPGPDLVTTKTETMGDSKLEDLNLSNAVMSTTVKLEYPTEYNSWSADQKKAYVDRYGGVSQAVTHFSVLEELNTLYKDIEAAQAKWSGKNIDTIKGEWANFKARANALNSKVGAPESPLSTEQKNGLADYGGIFTIENRVRPYVIYGPTIGGETIEKTTTCKREYRNGQLVTLNDTCKTTTKKLKDAEVKVAVSQKESQETLRNFWQILSVTCNKDGLERIAATLPDAKIYKGDGGNGTVYTRLYNANEKKPFGQSGSLTWASTDSFFKQTSGCEFVCKPVKTGGEAFFAKDSNGASITKDEGVFTYFRDNESKVINVNRWELAPSKSSNDVISISPERTIFNVNGNGLDEFKVDVNDVEISGVSHVSGAVDKFGVKSSWVSEVDKNQEVQVTWGYTALLNKYGIPNKVTGSSPGAVGGVYERPGKVSSYCHMGIEDAVTENNAPRNITPSGDKIYFNFVRATGE